MTRWPACRVRSNRQLTNAQARREFRPTHHDNFRSSQPTHHTRDREVERTERGPVRLEEPLQKHRREDAKQHCDHER